MKTAELIGPPLDWAVGTLEQDWSKEDLLANLVEDDDGGFYSPSTNWSQGGPIIERECIDLYCDYVGTKWRARKMLGEAGPMFYGPTPLIAAMRCYVASKLGDEVDIPEELI